MRELDNDVLDGRERMCCNGMYASSLFSNRISMVTFSNIPRVKCNAVTADTLNRRAKSPRRPARLDVGISRVSSISRWN